MPSIRAALFDLGDTLVSYYQPSEFMPILRHSLEACRLSLGHAPLGREEQIALVHQALELNQERADLAVWPLEERLRVLFSQDKPDAITIERLSAAFLAPIFARARLSICRIMATSYSAWFLSIRIWCPATRSPLPPWRRMAS